MTIKAEMVSIKAIFFEFTDSLSYFSLSASCFKRDLTIW
jgi:hypothetical protein